MDGYPTPTVTFSADDACKDESDSDIDDRFEDERSTRPAVPASATRTRTRPVENQSSYGRNTTSKTLYEQNSTDAKAGPVSNKARYGGRTASKTRYEQNSSDAKAEPVGNKARYGGSTAPKTRISKTARDLGSPIISRPRQQRRRSSSTSHQATVEDVEFWQNDAVDSSLLDPPGIDDFERDFSDTGALTTKILGLLVEETNKSDADASAESAPATMGTSIPVKGTSAEGVPPKLPTKKAAIKEAGPK
ncbi:hypothetical protein DV736_g1431, partial [Chaetothyriales sp. CBS 134916]